MSGFLKRFLPATWVKQIESAILFRPEDRNNLVQVMPPTLVNTTVSRIKGNRYPSPGSRTEGLASVPVLDNEDKIYNKPYFARDPKLFKRDDTVVINSTKQVKIDNDAPRLISHGKRAIAKLDYDPSGLRSTKTATWASLEPILEKSMPNHLPQPVWLKDIDELYADYARKNLPVPNGKRYKPKSMSSNYNQKQIRVNSRSVSSINLAPYGHSFGPVGRSANSGITATVFGAYGFIGRYIMEELGQIGTRVYVPFRGCELEVRHLKTAFDLGQLGFIPFSSRDKDSIIESVKNSDVVINLIGKHYETKHIVPTRRSNGKLSRINYDFDEVHVTIPQTIAKICAEVGVETFIHVSSLSADLESKSRWSQTKALGEIAVREAFPEAIIVKPATIFGPEDRFLNWFAEVSSRSPFMPILGDGSTLTQPVYSHDVAKAMLNIIYNHTEYEGKTFQLYGPAEYTYKEIAEFVGDITRLKKPLLSIPIPIALKAGSFIENLISPTLTYDMVLQMQENVLPKMMDNKNNNNWLTLKDLNIEPMSMDKVAFEYLHRFRQGGHFTLAEGYH